MTDTETAYNLALDYLYSFVDYSPKHFSNLADLAEVVFPIRQLLLSDCEIQFAVALNA